jgi:hypothetical protein
MVDPRTIRGKSINTPSRISRDPAARKRDAERTIQKLSFADLKTVTGWA